MFELLATAAILGTTMISSVGDRRCDAFETRAIVGGRVACLREGKVCRGRYQKQYRQNGFLCRRGSLEYDWETLHRPLRIPTIAAGTECPASTRRRKVPAAVSVNVSPAFGPGPAYPTLGQDSGRAKLEMVWPPTEPPYLGWGGTKVLWTAPTYTGAVLVRGRQLDGPHEVGFDLGPGWTNRVMPELRLRGPEQGLHPAATLVPAPGCYGYQIDVLKRSYIIVFEVMFAFG
jgi:hypothetical protein